MCKFFGMLLMACLVVLILSGCAAAPSSARVYNICVEAMTNANRIFQPHVQEELDGCQKQVIAAYEAKSKKLNWTDLCKTGSDDNLCLYYSAYGIASLERADSRYRTGRYEGRSQDTTIKAGDGQTVYQPSECIGPVIMARCQGQVLEQPGYHPKCYGEWLNGICTGPMF